MLRIGSYDEVIEWLQFPDGHVVLLPNEWDLAAQRALIATYEQRLEDYESEAVAPAILRHQEVVASYEKAPGQTPPSGEDPITEADYNRSREALKTWESGRIYDFQFLNQQITANYRLLERMENPTAPQKLKREQLRPGAAAPEGREDQNVYVLRTFSHEERVAVDDDHSIVDAATHQRKIDVNPRNVALLELVLEGEKGQDGVVIPIEHPAKTLPDAVVKTLINRMWARNSMDDQLVGYFRQCGAVPS